VKKIEYVVIVRNVH